MSQSRQATVCLLVQGDSYDQFERCFSSVLSHAPRERIQLRLAFGAAKDSFHYALGTLIPDNGWPTHCRLPGEVERFGLTTADGMRVWMWNTPRRVPRERLAKLLYHDAVVDTEYAICLDQDCCVQAGWWDALLPHLQAGIDYIGKPSWHDCTVGEAEWLQGQPWYMGVPLARREGRLGVEYMNGGCVAVRGERLREGEYPGEIWLGEMAHQLGWTRREG